MGGSLPSNCTSTTAPMTCVTLPPESSSSGSAAKERAQGATARAAYEGALAARGAAGAADAAAAARARRPTARDQRSAIAPVGAGCNAQQPPAVRMRRHTLGTDRSRTSVRELQWLTSKFARVFFFFFFCKVDFSMAASLQAGRVHTHRRCWVAGRRGQGLRWARFVIGREAGARRWERFHAGPACVPSSRARAQCPHYYARHARGGKVVDEGRGEGAFPWGRHDK